MSLHDIHRRKAIARAVSANVDANATYYHAMVDMWRVATTDPDYPIIMFNPKYNLDSAPQNATKKLFLLGAANKVYSTREKLCTLSCDLMSNIPNWSVIRDDTLSEMTLCPDCEHNMEHHYERFTAMPEHAREQIKQAIERAHPECTLSGDGRIILRHPR